MNDEIMSVIEDASEQIGGEVAKFFSNLIADIANEPDDFQHIDVEDIYIWFGEGLFC